MKTRLTTKGKVWLIFGLGFAVSYQIIMKIMNSGDQLTNLVVSLIIVFIVTGLTVSSKFTLKFNLEREVNE